ncbi:MAG: hypothetical protein ICV71_01485 [Thermoleophilia bacterium]|nr:hypothetical protein [Thermoleophilia bacterium]MDQ3858948.1 hypothetical protein [Actinomycetota bacterium]
MTFAATELPYAHTVARYGCPCGVVELRHGRGLQAPPGWVELASGENEGAAEYLCPRCAEAEARALPTRRGAE